MRLKDFFLKLHKKNEIEESKRRFQCNLTREQTTALVNIQLKREDRITPAQLWKFPWENEDQEEQNETSDDLKTDQEVINNSNKLFDMIPD
jgi:hypothetical protein